MLWSTGCALHVMAGISWFNLERKTVSCIDNVIKQMHMCIFSLLTFRWTSNDFFHTQMMRTPDTSHTHCNIIRSRKRMTAHALLSANAHTLWPTHSLKCVQFRCNDKLTGLLKPHTFCMYHIQTRHTMFNSTDLGWMSWWKKLLQIKMRLTSMTNRSVAPVLWLG